MEVTTAMVEKLAHLARLQFTDKELAAYTGDLQNMVAFVEQLNAVNTNGIEPLLHMGNTVNNLRTDEISGSISRQEALLNAPVTDGIYFKVPKVIKK
jgi:aspartyl-tRNA(Asn)/glutamyl-tRNA(Gln) amidotransferase subunit C